MIHNQNRLTFIRLSILAFWTIGFLPTGTAQVPVDQLPQSPKPNSGEINQTPSVEEFGLGVLSDPAELSLVDGLDEELERLRLRDQDTTGILEMIQIITGRYILRPQNLPQVKINFDSFTVLTKRETLRALESLLAMNGIGISKIDDQFFKAVPASGMNVHVPIWLDGPALAIKPSQRIYVKMFHLEYAPALEVREQLNPFSTPNVGTLIVFEKANSILATDSLLNLQRMEQLLTAIDRPISKDELGTEFFIWETQHAGAKELEGKLKGMVEGSLKPFLGGTTQVDSDERTGKLIVVTRKENLETIKFILETLDSPIKMKATSEHFKLQHAEAKDITDILNEVIESQKQVKEKVQKSNTIRPASGTTAKNVPVPSKSSSLEATSESEGAHEFSELITIAANERGNGILVYGTKSDLIEIKRMIDSLDEPLPLAKIETIFMMVDINEESKSGIDSLLSGLQYSKIRQTSGQSGTNTLSPSDDSVSTSSDAILSGNVKLPLLNSTVGFGLQNWNLSVIEWDQIFAAASGRSDVRVFSSPSLMVTHNHDSAKIKVGREITYVTTTYTNRTVPGSSNTESVPQKTSETISAETILEIIKPKIGLPIFEKENPDKILKPGSIFMEIKVDANKFDYSTATTYDGQVIPGLVTRNAETVVTAKSGEIVVLGGLQETILSEISVKFNLLSSIPYFGKKFFSPKDTEFRPNELLIFIKPTILNPDSSNTETNTELIDSRLLPNYEPVFTSPTGKKLIYNPGKVKTKNSAVDTKSKQPSLF